MKTMPGCMWIVAAGASLLLNVVGVDPERVSTCGVSQSPPGDERQPESPPRSIEELRKLRGAARQQPMLHPMTPGPISRFLIDRHVPLVIEAGMDEDELAAAIDKYRFSFRELDKSEVHWLGETAAALSSDIRSVDGAADAYADVYSDWHAARNAYLTEIEDVDRAFFLDLEMTAQSPDEIVAIVRFRRERQRERCMALALVGVGVNVDLDRLARTIIEASPNEIDADALAEVEQHLIEYRNQHRLLMCALSREIEQFMLNENVTLGRFLANPEAPAESVADARESLLQSKRRVRGATTPIWRVNRNMVEAMAEALPREPAWRLREAYFQTVGDPSCFPDRSDVMPLFLALDEVDDLTDEQAELLGHLESEYVREYASLNHRLLEAHWRYREQALRPSTLGRNHTSGVKSVQSLLNSRGSLTVRALDSIASVLYRSQVDQIAETIASIRTAAEQVPRAQSYGPVFHQR